MARVAVLGAGAWGTALAIQAARAGNRVCLWSQRTPIDGRVSRRLPGFPLPDAVEVAGALPTGADAILVAVPTQQLRSVVGGLRPDAPLLVCCKGLEQSTGLLPLEVVGALHPGTQAAVLTGPNFAAEVAAGLPSASVVAAADASLRARMIGLLGSPGFRLYGSADPIGAQLGGAAKNVIAIGAGAVIGAGLGENARAALVTRGLAELSRLIVAEGGRARTASGLSGMGDLVLTCTGAGSRNFAYGLALGRGTPPVVDGVVEGVHTAGMLVARAGSIDLPLCRAVAELVAGLVSLDEAIGRLLSRRLRDEA